MDIQALGMLSNITAIVQKQNVNTISGDINVEKDFYGTLRAVSYTHRKKQNLGCLFDL